MQNSFLRPSEKAVYDLRALYRTYGYRYYKVSRFEEYDLYAKNKSFLADKNVLTFTDTDGRLMALKPDVTLSIIKNTDVMSGMQKVFYNEQVYRTNGGGFCEIMQTGLECIGDIDLYSTAEVINLAYKSLELINEDFIIDLSHMGFVLGLVSNLTQDESVSRRLTNAVSDKNTAEIQAVCQKIGADPKPLCTLAMLYGTSEYCLDQMKQLIVNDKMQSAWQELYDITEILKQQGIYKNIRLDFSVINDMRYYNGIIFRGFINGVWGSVLSGGRYDNLMLCMGKNCGAIGFAVYLDKLDRLLMQKSETDVDILLVYEKGTPPVVVAKEVQKLSQGNKTVRAQCGEKTDLRVGTVIKMEV